MRKCERTIYGLPETSDRVAAMLRDDAGSYSERRRHIRHKMAQIRRRKLELGLEGNQSGRRNVVPQKYAPRVIAVSDIAAAASYLD